MSKDKATAPTGMALTHLDPVFRERTDAGRRTTSSSHDRGASAFSVDPYGTIMAPCVVVSERTSSILIAG
jgi:hypothetical protein